MAHDLSAASEIDLKKNKKMESVPSTQWTVWRDKLIAVGYPEAETLNENALTRLMFRPTSQRKQLIRWVADKIVETTGIKEKKDILRIFLNFVYGRRPILTCFIEGTANVAVMRKYWDYILDNLKPMESIDVDEQTLLEYFRSGTKVTLEQFVSSGIFPIPGLEEAAAEAQEEAQLVGADADAVASSRAVLTKYETVEPSSTNDISEAKKPTATLVELNKDAKILCERIQKVDPEGRISKQLSQMSVALKNADDFDKCVAAMKDANLALKKASRLNLVY